MMEDLLRASTTIVLPAYNEESSLREFLPVLLNWAEINKCKLIIVNDGSSDGTSDFLTSFKGSRFLNIVDHKLNKGYGGALKTGILASQTEYTITIDADGQHKLDDVTRMIEYIQLHDADMVVGRRPFDKNYYRAMGKKAIRFFAKLLMKIPIEDLNSGMKIYRTTLVQKYLRFCPDTMAFSDVITLLFIYNRNLVCEVPIEINQRRHGKSTINYKTALTTIYEILNIVLMFNPIKIFLPSGLFFIVAGFLWGLPIALASKGISVGASLSISIGILIIFFGLLAEQISQIRKQL